MTNTKHALLAASALSLAVGGGAVAQAPPLAGGPIDPRCIIGSGVPGPCPSGPMFVAPGVAVTGAPPAGLGRHAPPLALPTPGVTMAPPNYAYVAPEVAYVAPSQVMAAPAPAPQVFASAGVPVTRNLYGTTAYAAGSSYGYSRTATRYGHHHMAYAQPVALAAPCGVQPCGPTWVQPPPVTYQPPPLVMARPPVTYLPPPVVQQAPCAAPAPTGCYVVPIRTAEAIRLPASFFGGAHTSGVGFSMPLSAPGGGGGFVVGGGRFSGFGGNMAFVSNRVTNTTTTNTTVVNKPPSPPCCPPPPPPCCH